MSLAPFSAIVCTSRLTSTAIKLKSNVYIFCYCKIWLPRKNSQWRVSSTVHTLRKWMETDTVTAAQSQRCSPSCYFREGLANNEGGMSSWLSPLTENSRSARCCNVPPHLRPRHIRAALSVSRPSCSRSAAVLYSSKFKLSSDTDTYTDLFAITILVV